MRLRSPYVDAMNAIQVELLGRYRNGDERALRPLLRSITGIAPPTPSRATTAPTSSLSSSGAITART